MLTGRPPFAGGTAQQVLAAQVSEAPPPLSKYRTTVPPALAETVMRCLEKNPADRWQSADDLLHQLEVMATPSGGTRSEEHTSELQSRQYLVCRLLPEKKTPRQ